MTILKRLSMILIALTFMAGCTKGDANKPVGIEALKLHLKKTESTVTLTPMADAFADLVADPAEKQQMLDNAKTSYDLIGVEQMYLVTATTATSNDSLIGSLIEFKMAMTLDEAKAQLAKDENFKDPNIDIFMNGKFAYAVSTMNGKRMTPKSILTAFQNFK